MRLCSVEDAHFLICEALATYLSIHTYHMYVRGKYKDTHLKRGFPAAPSRHGTRAMEGKQVPSVHYTQHPMIIEDLVADSHDENFPLLSRRSTMLPF